MKTLMRNGRDRRSENPGRALRHKSRAIDWDRSADHIRASGQNGRIQRPNTWLHPNASQKGQILLLHRGRRPYMALKRRSVPPPEGPVTKALRKRVYLVPDGR